MFSIVRRVLALAFGSAGRRDLHDPADMGTAFGLDASTFLEPDSEEDLAARDTVASHFEHRLKRRSSL